MKKYVFGFPLFVVYCNCLRMKTSCVGTQNVFLMNKIKWFSLKNLDHFFLMVKEGKEKIAKTNPVNKEKWMFPRW